MTMLSSINAAIGCVARAAAVLAVSVGLASCGGALKTDFQVAKERARSYVAAHPEVDEKTREAILQSEVRVGMNKEQVIAAWGHPVRVTRFHGGRQEEWIFGCDYPHQCTIQRTRAGNPLFDSVKHESTAIFMDGIVTRFSY